MAKNPNTSPWKRPRPKTGAKKKLSAAQIEAARERAERSGRRYPNLVDNMWAARLKPAQLARRGRAADTAGPDD